MATNTELENLQRVLDESLAAASSLTRSVFQRSSLDARGVQTLVNAIGTATVATARADGRPHATLIPIGCLDGRIHLAVTAQSTLHRQLSRDPNVAVTAARSLYEHSVIGEGVVTMIGPAANHRDLLRALRQAVDLDFPGDSWSGHLFAFQPRRLFAR